jgi:hypothetical protein
MEMLLCQNVRASSQSLTLNEKDTGYRGIWYMNQPSGDEYVYKYSGGLGTYCAKHKPFAVYCDKVKQLTKDSPCNHTYARRPVNANPDFTPFGPTVTAENHRNRLYISVTNKVTFIFCRERCPKSLSNPSF